MAKKARHKAAESAFEFRSGERIPKALKSKFQDIVELTQAYCLKTLDEEYGELCRRSAARLARKRSSILGKGYAKGWAAGIVADIADINELFAEGDGEGIVDVDMAAAFGVAVSTLNSKAQAVARTYTERESLDDFTHSSLKEAQMHAAQSFVEVLPDPMNPSAGYALVNMIASMLQEAEPVFAMKRPQENYVDESPQVSELPGSKTPVLQLKITLDGTEPLIWRRVLVDHSTNLSDLHYVIQDVMGWFDGHLHFFQSGSKRFADLNTDMDPRSYDDELLVPVGALLKKKGQVLRYVYDFGDDWQHTIVLEKRLKASENVLPYCIEGERACPLEDCGGIDGYYRILDHFKQKPKDQDPYLTEWIPEDYDPDVFDLKEVNDLLSEGPPKSQAALIGKAKPQYSFFLNIYPGQGFTRCVHCGAKNRSRKLRFLIDAYQHGLQCIPIDTKFCGQCEIVVVQEKKLNASLKKQLVADYGTGDLEEFEGLSKDDYFVVGTLNKSYKAVGALEDEALEDILEALSNFRERLNVLDSDAG